MTSDILLKTRSGRPSSQRADELLPFIDLLKERNVRSYLEIGARHGDTFYQIMMALPARSIGVAVDLPGGAWGKRGTEASLESACRDLDLRGFDISVILGDSGSASVIEKVQRRAPFDAVFIDGDHRLPAVTRDWQVYGKMAPIVAFHDIAGEGQLQKTSLDAVEVPALWAEIKRSHETIEFIGASRGMGIGVVLR